MEHIVCSVFYSEKSAGKIHPLLNPKENNMNKLIVKVFCVCVSIESDLSN